MPHSSAELIVAETGKPHPTNTKIFKKASTDGEATTLKNPFFRLASPAEP
jgi:hypothetical protein